MVKPKFLKIDKLYKYSAIEKKNFFNNKILKLIKFHNKNSKNFNKFLKNFSTKVMKKIDDIPDFPVTNFKKYDLLSTKRSNIIKTLHSSGTSSAFTSKIFLDIENSRNQTWVLSKIMENIFGKKRLPMIIIEKKPNFSGSNRNDFNARLAAINGFSIFAKKRFFIFDENNQINYNAFNKYLDDYCKNTKFIFFGFTDQVFKFFFKSKLNQKYKKYFKNSILIHGGGWKKLENEKIDNRIFKKNLFFNFGMKNIYNYYGLIEQTGSIFIECPECSSFKCTIYSDVILRDKNLNIIKNDNQIGFLQVMSTIPSSYPGNVVLTEDLAVFTNNLKCKKCKTFKGNRFRVLGRITNSEIRGCANI